METINIKVPSELYGVTDCVISLDAIKRGFAPCGDGCDYKFNAGELEVLNRIANGENIEFKIDNSIVTLYHGTNVTNQKNIIKRGMFRPFAWFAADYKTAKRYALMASKRVSSAMVMTVNIDKNSLYCNGDYYTAKGKLILKDNVWKQP